jgi:hypothetical protein
MSHEGRRAARGVTQAMRAMTGPYHAAGNPRSSASDAIV